MDIQELFRREVEDEAWHYSPLGRFMRDQPEQIRAVLAASGGDWALVARALAHAGLADHTGQPPTAETARETWRRVEERRRAGVRSRAVSPQPLQCCRS